MAKAGGRGERESSLASGWTVRSEPDAAETVVDGTPDDGGAPGADAAERSPQLGNTMLVVLGVLGGLFLLYAWIWLSWAQAQADFNSIAAATSGALGGALQRVLFWFAPVAPLLWFAATLLLNRGRESGETLRSRGAIVWLVIGAVVLFPFPMLTGIGGA